MFSSDVQRHSGRYYGKYSGRVVDNDDPTKTGRLQVTVPSVLRDLVVWARPCLPYGHFFVPPNETMVWVEFEAGDPNYPLWVGVWYRSEDVPQVAQVQPPEQRVIHTASGHTVEFQDKEGENNILIRHKDNSFISLDKDGSVLVSNKRGSFLYLNAKDKQATFMEQHGHLVTMTEDGVLITNKDSTLVELKGDTARIAAANVLLQGTTVVVGAAAGGPPAEPTIMGQTFATQWAIMVAHTHGSAVGPTTPPVPVAMPLTPGNGLTGAAMVK